MIMFVHVPITAVSGTPPDTDKCGNGSRVMGWAKVQQQDLTIILRVPVTDFDTEKSTFAQADFSQPHKV